MKRANRIGRVYQRRDGTWEAATGSGAARRTRRVPSAAEGWRWLADLKDAPHAREIVAPHPSREMLAARFTAEAIEARLLGTDYAASSREAIRSTAAWIRSACADLLAIPMPERYGEERTIRHAFAQITARRTAPTIDRKTGSALIELDGRWQVRDGALLRNGTPIVIKDTAPRLISLIAGIDPGSANLTDAPKAAAALEELRSSGTPQSENRLGRAAVETLRRRGLVEITIAPVRDARRAILALIERSPRREAEIGATATKTLLAKGWARRLDARAFATSARLSPRTRTYLNATLALAVEEEGGVAWLPKRRGYGARVEQETTNLAAMSDSDRPKSEDLRALVAHLVACADGGDALDRILALEAALGLRQPEARGLKVGDFDGAVLTIRRNRLEDGRAAAVKTRKSSAWIEVPEPMRSLLAAWSADRDPGAWLVGDEPRLSNARIETRRRARLREIGLKPTLIASDLRHVGATLVAEATTSEEQARRFLRHEVGSKATRRYIEPLGTPIGADLVRIVVGD